LDVLIGLLYLLQKHKFACSTLNENFIETVRNNTLKVYPETITFKFIRYLPEFLLEKEVKLLGTA